MRNIIEETYEKEGVRNSVKFAAIRAEIKKLSNEQLILKPQRKTVKFTGTRTTPAWSATDTALENRFQLRHLYIVYAILKGVERPEVTKKEVFKSLIDRYITEYTYKE